MTYAVCMSSDKVSNEHENSRLARLEQLEGSDRDLAVRNVTQFFDLLHAWQVEFDQKQEQVQQQKHKEVSHET